MKYSICITTFKDRFDLLKNLIKSLRDFTDSDIFIAVNGQANQKFCNNYRREVLTLCRNYQSIYPIFFLEPRGLSKMWNTLIAHSSTENNLMLNDDVEITTGDFDSFCKENQPKIIGTINYNFSHFLVNKNIFHDMKGFDERFLGFGNEDTDFKYRYASKYKQKIPNFMVHGMRNLDSQLFDSGVINRSGSKYSEFNNTFFLYGQNPKYIKSDDGDIAVDTFVFPVKKNLEEEPQYIYENFFKENKHKLYK
jgi:predicted glycosyltransferase involved in capsule biosynthesis